MINELKRRWQQANTPIDYTWNGSQDDWSEVQNTPHILLGPLGVHAGYQGLSRATQALAERYNKPAIQGLNYAVQHMWDYPKVPQLPYEMGTRATFTPFVERIPQQIGSAVKTIGNTVGTKGPVTYIAKTTPYVPFTLGNVAKAFHNGVAAPMLNTGLAFTANALVLASPFLRDMMEVPERASYTMSVTPHTTNASITEEGIRKATEFANSYVETPRQNDDQISNNLLRIAERKNELDDMKNRGTEGQQQYALEKLMEPLTTLSDDEADQFMQEHRLIPWFASLPENIISELRDSWNSEAQRRFDNEYDQRHELLNQVYYDP